MDVPVDPAFAGLRAVLPSLFWWANRLLKRASADEAKPPDPPPPPPPAGRAARLWASIPGGSFEGKITFLGFVAALLPALWWGYGWLRGKDIETVGPRIEQRLIDHERLLIEQQGLLKVLQQKLEQNGSPGTGAASPGPTIESEVSTDLKAGFQTLLKQGYESALRDKTGEAAQAAIDGLIAELDAARQGMVKEEAALWRQKGAFAFLHDTNAALRAYGKAAELDPDDANGRLNLGRLQARFGNLPAAKASFERVLALGNSIADPQFLHWTHMLLGDVEAELGNRPTALDQYDRAVARIKSLAERDPANAEWQRDLSVSYNKIADIRSARGDRDGALASYEDGLRIAKALAERDPANAEWQRDLSVSYERVGDIRRARGDRDGALASYEDGLRIAKALAERDPANAEWQTDLVVSAWKLAAMGAPDACGRLRNGLAILKRLDAENRLTADQKDRWIPAIESAIAEKCG